MYIFINENEIVPYSGEILKRYVGNRLVKTIANPTDNDLKEFGYLPLVEANIPEYDVEKQYLVEKYELKDDCIQKSWIIEEMQFETI